MEGVLIIAPQGRNARVIESQLRTAQIDCTIATPRQLLSAIEHSHLSAAIITDDALNDADLLITSAALAAQPTWSDCPFIVLTSRSKVAQSGMRAAAALGNVTMLECPLHPTALISAARAALRARDRQRKAQAYLSARLAAEEEVTKLAITLEARVAERTAALTHAIEERAAAQTLLDESLATYRHTIELSALTPWTAAADGSARMVDQTRFGIAGETFSPTIYGDWADCLHPDDIAATLAAWTAAVVTVEPFDCLSRTRIWDDRYRWMRWRAAPRLASDGSVIRWYGTIEDVDAQHQANLQLQQVQSALIHVSRLSAMGALAATIAHELNQPLAAITNYVRGCRRLVEAHNSDVQRDLIDALRAADDSSVRAGEIVRRLRDLVTRGDIARHSEHLPTLIDEACGIAMVDAATLGITYRKRFDRRRSMVLVDRIQVQQVVINLLRNAVEAIGTVRPGKILIETLGRHDGFAEVSVQDNGVGLDAEREERLFMPFNSSKQFGMGVGLSISQTIVEAHGGRIWHEPASNGGTIFRFTLPNA